jgi:hypothetical protein
LDGNPIGYPCWKECFAKTPTFEANVDISENRVPNTVELPGATRGQVRNIKILDAAEAAAIMRMDSRTLIRWARLGYVPAHPLGEGKRRLWRFIEDEILDWFEKRTQVQKRAPARSIDSAIRAPARRSA